MDASPPARAGSAVRAALRSLVALPPGPGPRLWIAIRAAASIAVPFGVLALLGHEAAGLQASSGAFVALFAASATAAERAKVLPFVGVALLLSAALGAALSPWPWLLAAGLVLVAVSAAALAFAFRVGPPGPVFAVLAYGLAGSITAVVGGARVNAPLAFLAALAGGLLFSYGVALLPLLSRAERARPARPLRELLPGPWLGPGERELVLRVLAVALAGTLLGLVLDPHRAYWTVSAGVAVVGLAALRGPALSRGLHRTVGTMVGAALYVAIAPLGAAPLLLVALLAALQFLIELVVVRNYALALVFITPLVLLITGAATGGVEAVATAGERVLDTAVGSVLAILSGLIHRRRAGG